MRCVGVVRHLWQGPGQRCGWAKWTVPGACRLFTAGPPPMACLDGVRGVLRLSGDTSLTFLQGLITNDMRNVEADVPVSQRTPMYAALLNAQGRQIHDMHITRTEDPTPTLLLDVDADYLDALLRVLKRYRLRQPIEMDDVSDDYSVWVQFGGADAGGDTEGAEPMHAWPIDPRLPALGRRMLLSRRELAPGVSSRDDAVAAATRFAQYRASLGVAEGDTEMPHGVAIPLEYNMDGLNGVAYDKGCYIGQELVARTHYKGVIRKRLMPFRFDPDQGTPACDDDVYAPGTKRAVGSVRVAHAATGWGLALLRLASALPAAAGEGPGLNATRGSAAEGTEGSEAQAIPIRPVIPAFWPPEWAEAGE